MPYLWTIGDQVTADRLNQTDQPNLFFHMANNGTPSPALLALVDSLVMTNGGEYFFEGGASLFEYWRSYKARHPVYRRTRDGQRTGLSISPSPFCRVTDGSTERILAAAAGGTSLYRYNFDGTSEQLVTVSGTSLVGVRRIGWDPYQNYVYIQDDATNKAGTNVKRFTFTGSTLTYVDTITLSVAPDNTGSANMWIGQNYLCFGGIATNASQVKFLRYTKNAGVNVADYTHGHGTLGVTAVGFAVRGDDNACMFGIETSGETSAFTLFQDISPVLDLA